MQNEKEEKCEQVAKQNEANEASEFIKCVEKLIFSSETVDRHLENIQKYNKEFLEFEKQELKLKAIKQTLESLSVALKTSLLHKKSITFSSDKETSEKVDNIVSKLVLLHQNVVKKYKEKNEYFLKNLQKWNEFNSDFESLQNWLKDASSRIKTLDEKNFEHSHLKEILKGVSNITENRLLLERININGDYILIRSNDTDALYLTEKLSIINQEWKCLIELLNELKKKFSSSIDKTKDQDLNWEDNYQETSLEINLEWIKNCQEYIEKELILNNEFNIEQALFQLKAKHLEIVARKTTLENEINKSELNSKNIKHDGLDILTMFEQTSQKYESKRTELETFYKQYKHFKHELNKLDTWIKNHTSNEILLSQLSTDEIRGRIEIYKKIKNDYNQLVQNKIIRNEQGLFKIADDLKKTWETLNLEKLLENKILESNRKDNDYMPPTLDENCSRPNQQEFLDNEFSIINIRDTDNSISKVTLREEESTEIFDVNSAENQADSFCNDLLDWILWINHNLDTQIVTIGNFEEIQQSINKYNTILEEIDKKQAKLGSLLESKSADVIQDKLISLNGQWVANKSKVIAYKEKLESILKENKLLDEVFDNFSKHVVDLETQIQKQSEISFGESTLQRQKIDHNTITVDYEILTKLYDDLKEKYEDMMEKYSSEDMTKLEIKFNRIDTRFKELSDRLKLREDNLNQTSKIIFEFEKNLEDFSKWLEKIEKDLNYIEDYFSQSDETTKAITDINRELQKEIESNSFTFTSLNQTSKKILESLKTVNEKQKLADKLSEINKKWDCLIQKSMEIKTRLETNNNAECGAILKSLKDLKYWCKTKDKELQDMKRQVQPDPGLMLKLLEENNIFRSNIEFKKPLMENSLISAKSYLKENYKNEITKDKIDESVDEENFDIENIDESTIMAKLSHNVSKLENQWIQLYQNFINYELKLHSFYQNLILLNKSFVNVTQKLEENETILENLNSSIDHNEISDENQLTENLEKVKIFQISITSLQPIIEEMNQNFVNLSHDLQFFNEEQNNILSLEITQNIQTKYDDLNLRWSTLQQHIQEIYLHLYSLAEKPESNIFFKLSSSVQPPWQRSVSSNKIPYYINHSTEITTWDHPKMIELYKSFANLNDIRFSAYRTAMKLRTLQKRLWLDYVDLNDALNIFESLGTKMQNDKILDSNQIVQILNQIFQTSIKSNESQMIDFVSAIDMTLNWLLSVYDPTRCGHVKSVSLKVAITLLSNGSIEDKYIYLFNLMTDEKGFCTSKKLGVLLYEMIMIPKQLGEVAAFGGSNIEPSVKSCFEYAKAKDFIVLDQFLNWLKLEPQSIVWLPVLHRLSAAESARHEAKCSICKEYPIIGFRYRSLKHFNFDICQTCFFSGRKVKGFKFDHPLLEYYSPTSSSDDIKDFFKIFKNKFRTKRGRRSSKLGYLPVQSFFEGSEAQTLHYEKIDTHLNDELKKVIQDQKENSIKTSARIVMNENECLQTNFVGNVSVEPVRFENNKININDLAKLESNIEPIDETPKKKSHISFIENEKSDDEHLIIAKICNTLYNETVRNNEKLNIEDTYQQVELENMIKDLEEENMILIEEYNNLKSQLKSNIRDNIEENRHSSKQDLSHIDRFSIIKSISNLQINDGNQLYDTFNRSCNIYNTNAYNRRTLSQYTDFNDFLNITETNKDRLSLDRESQMFIESNIIKQQENKLEARMKILENHNRLLDAQLKNLKNLLISSKKKNSNYYSANEVNLTESSPSHKSTKSTLKEARYDPKKLSNRSSSNNISTLFLNVEDITKAINNLNNLVNAMGVLDDGL